MAPDGMRAVEREDADQHSSDRGDRNCEAEPTVRHAAKAKAVARV
jgi:hypothetical protein